VFARFAASPINRVRQRACLYASDPNRLPRPTGYCPTRPIGRMPENTRRRWSAESPHLPLVGSRGLDSLQNSHDLPFRRLEPLLMGFDLLFTSGLAGQSFSRTAVRGIGQRIWQPRSSTCFVSSDRSVRDHSGAEPDDVVQTPVARLGGQAASRATKCLCGSRGRNRPNPLMHLEIL